MSLLNISQRSPSQSITKLEEREYTPITFNNNHAIFQFDRLGFMSMNSFLILPGVASDGGVGLPLYAGCFAYLEEAKLVCDGVELTSCSKCGLYKALKSIYTSQETRKNIEAVREGTNSTFGLDPNEYIAPRLVTNEEGPRHSRDKYRIQEAKYQNGGAAKTISIVDGGSGYSAGTYDVLGGTGHSLTVAVTVDANGAIDSATIATPGQDYLADEEVVIIEGTGANAITSASIKIDEIESFIDDENGTQGTYHDKYSVTTSAETTAHHYLRLKDLFPLLDTSYLPLGMLDKQLELHIKFTDNSKSSGLNKRVIYQEGKLQDGVIDLIEKECKVVIEHAFFDEETTALFIERMNTEGINTVFSHPIHIQARLDGGNQPANGTSERMSYNISLGLANLNVRSLLCSVIKPATSSAMSNNLLNDYHAYVGSHKNFSYNFLINGLLELPRDCEDAGLRYHYNGEIFQSALYAPASLQSNMGCVFDDDTMNSTDIPVRVYDDDLESATYGTFPVAKKYNFWEAQCPISKASKFLGIDQNELAMNWAPFGINLHTPVMTDDQRLVRIYDMMNQGRQVNQQPVIVQINRDLTNEDHGALDLHVYALVERTISIQNGILRAFY